MIHPATRAADSGAASEDTAVSTASSPNQFERARYSDSATAGPNSGWPCTVSTPSPITPATAQVSALLKRGLLESDSPYGKLRLGVPQHALRFYFPSLWPEAEAHG